MATVTENWSSDRLSLAAPWTATREFIVSDVSGNALTALTASGIPQRNDPHPRKSTMLCEGPEVVAREGYDFFRVRCTYRIPQYGIQSKVHDSPVDDAPRIQWSNVILSEPIDTDLDKRPIFNGAEDVPDQLPTRDFYIKRLTIRRFEPYYDPGRVIDYENSVNASDTTALGFPVAANHMRMVSILPVGEYPFDQAFLPIEYVFDIITPSGVMGPHPFQINLLNAGLNGWYSDSGTKRKARFYTSQDQVREAPVLLTSTGTPYDTTADNVKVGKDLGAAVTCPNSVSTMAIYSAGFSGGAARGLKFVYRRIRTVELTPLLSTFTYTP